MKYIEAERVTAEIDKIIDGLKRNCNPDPLGTTEECLADAEIEALGLVKDIIGKMKQDEPTPPGIEEESQKKGWLDYGLIMNEYGDCTREQMLAYLTKIQNLQKKAAGKMTVDVHLLHDSGAIFGGVVREPEISICVTIMDVYDHEDYQKSWDLYQFYPANKNDELFADFKKDIEQFIKDFDKEWKRRRANYIKRHGKDCV